MYTLLLQYHQSQTNNKVGGDREKAKYTLERQKVFIDADLHKRPGLFLQQLRKANGLSLYDVAEQIKVSSNLLQNIEEQHFDALPVPVYLRGFLRQFAKIVNVPDVEALIDSFMALYKGEQ